MSTMKEQTDIRDRSFIEVNRYDHREDVLNDLMNRLEDLQRKITNLYDFSCFFCLFYY